MWYENQISYKNTFSIEPGCEKLSIFWNLISWNFLLNTKLATTVGRQATGLRIQQSSGWRTIVMSPVYGSCHLRKWHMSFPYTYQLQNFFQTIVELKVFLNNSIFSQPYICIWKLYRSEIEYGDRLIATLVGSLLCSYNMNTVMYIKWTSCCSKHMKYLSKICRDTPAFM